MDKNYYEVLGLNEDEIVFFLSTNDDSEIPEGLTKIRDEIVKEAFKKRNDEIEEKYNRDLDIIEKYHTLEIGVVELGKKKNKADERNKDRIEEGFETAELQYSNAKESIDKQYEIDIQQLKLAYEQLKTEESRRAYNKQLSIEPYHEMKKIAEDVEKKYRIEKYNKKDQYNPDLLETIHDGKLAGEKAVLRKPTKEPMTIALNDERNIRIKQTGTVHYRNVTSTYNSYVNEYEITRNVVGEEKTDTVYTELSLLRLGTKRKKDELVDPNYYDCVVNKLLSEDAIEGAKKFNGGYIGLIEEGKKGKIDTTIDKPELSAEDLENLAAVMALKEREEREEREDKDGQEPEGEAR